jgi:aspartate racemase
VSIVEAAAEYADRHQCKTLGLFGTKSTMQRGFYQTVFSRKGIQVVTPPEESQKYIHEKYMNEFVKGDFLEDTKKKILEIANTMIHESAIDGLILGGTELPFILKQEDFHNVRLLNTTEIHVRRILDYAMNE